LGQELAADRLRGQANLHCTQANMTRVSKYLPEIKAYLAIEPIRYFKKASMEKVTLLRMCLL
jgi:hypothetical protein